MNYPHGECSYMCAESARRFNVGGVLVLHTPPAGLMGYASSGGSGLRLQGRSEQALDRDRSMTID